MPSRPSRSPAPWMARSLTAPTAATIAATASDPDGTIASVEFFVNGASLGADTTFPYSVAWTGAPAGAYTLRARRPTTTAATRRRGGGARQPGWFVEFGDLCGRWTPQPKAVGSGRTGQTATACPATPPAIRATRLSASPAPSTGPGRPPPATRGALQRASGTGRLAATWYGGTFTFDVNLTDGQPHTVAVYLLDWDAAGPHRAG